MLIKPADGKAKDIEILKGLLNHPDATVDVKRKIKDEIRTIRSGVKGENDVAYEINFYFESLNNWAIIHDLRVEHGRRTAQIDHILINNLLEIWVCESKRFAGGMEIDEQGNYKYLFNGKAHAMKSPFEQNRKHCAVLKAVCDDVAAKLPKRPDSFIKPAIKSLVIVSNDTNITGPKSDIKGHDEILKADKIKDRIDKDRDNDILWADNCLSSKTLEDFARRLVDKHKPKLFDWYAMFGLSRETTQPEASNSIPKCIKCGNPMKLINGKKGYFWGCSHYPECSSTQSCPRKS